MCATDRLSCCFRKAEMLHLTRENEIPHRSCHVFNGDVRINTVLVEQIDGLDLEPFQRGVGDLFDVLWPTIQSLSGSCRLDAKTELGGDHHLTMERYKCFAHKPFVCEWAIGLCRIKERDTAFHSCSDKSYHLLLVCCRAVICAHS